MSFTFHSDFPDATNDHKWEQIRAWRDAELLRSDWTQVEDSPVNKAAWATYRQALRDLPSQGGQAEAVIFPVKP